MFVLLQDCREDVLALGGEYIIVGTDECTIVTVNREVERSPLFRFPRRPCQKYVLPVLKFLELNTGTTLMLDGT